LHDALPLSRPGGAPRGGNWRVPGVESGRGPHYAPPVSGRRLTDLTAGALVRALIDVASEPVLVLDDDGGVAEASASACELLGMPREEVVGRAPAHPWVVDGLIAHVRRF